MPPRPAETIPATSRRGIAWRVATLGGLGLVPWAPGTVASFVVAGVWFTAAVVAPGTVFRWGGAAAGAVLAAALWSAQVVCRETPDADPGEIVADEAAGMLVALIALPPDPKATAAAFVLFRALDILKPPPLRGIERAGGGAGIVADDVLAGAATNAVLHGLLAVFPGAA